MTKAERLIGEIKKLQAELDKHQNRCKHPKKHVTKTHGASTGNYDPYEDRYWTDFNCSLCGKGWTEEGSK